MKINNKYNKIILLMFLSLLFGCNFPEKGYNYYSFFDYSTMKGEKEITASLLKSPYIATKREGSKIELKIFGQCDNVTIENFEQKEGYWYGYGQINNKVSNNSNLKKESLSYENHYYIFNDTILKYQITHNLNDNNDEYPISITLKRKNKLYEFASLEDNYSRNYNIDKLKKSSFSINGNYSVTETNVKRDTLINRIETIYKDGSNELWLSKYKLNGTSLFFIDDNCNNKITQLSFERVKKR